MRQQAEGGREGVGAAPGRDEGAAGPSPVLDWTATAKRALLTGLAVVLPAVLTVYILWLLFQVTGAIFAVPVEFLAGHLVGWSLGGRPPPSSAQP